MVEIKTGADFLIGPSYPKAQSDVQKEPGATMRNRPPAL
jgi:hypothetical protein